MCPQVSIWIYNLTSWGGKDVPTVTDITPHSPHTPLTFLQDGLRSLDLTASSLLSTLPSFTPYTCFWISRLHLSTSSFFLNMVGGSKYFLPLSMILCSSFLSSSQYSHQFPIEVKAYYEHGAYYAQGPVIGVHEQQSQLFDLGLEHMVGHHRWRTGPKGLKPAWSQELTLLRTVIPLDILLRSSSSQ